MRAPDENVYIPPFNLVEMIVIALFEWWMPKHRFEQFNDLVMGICYSPVLVFAAWFESRTAGSIVRNRSRGEEDDDVAEEWEQTTVEVNFESDGWDKICQGAASNVEIEPAVQEVQKLRAEVDELKKLLLEISKAVGAGKADDLIQFDKGGKDGGKDTAKSSQGSTVGGE